MKSAVDRRQSKVGESGTPGQTGASTEYGIEVEAVSRDFGPVRALDKVSLGPFHIAYTTPKDLKSQTCGWNPQLDQPIALTDLYNTPGDDFGKEGFVFVFPARHNGGNNYLFYDGHVKWMKSFLGRNLRLKDD